MLIKNIMINSKEKLENSLFICINGDCFDSHEFVDEAISNGAIAIMSERPINTSVVNIVVDDTKKELAHLASLYYNHPQFRYHMNGITGTDGKTTTSIILKTLLSNSCYIGTNGIMYNGIHEKTPNTTINILKLNELLYRLPNNINNICMEISSKGIKDKRVINILFDRIIYTNITLEHLNEHLDFSDYRNTKLSIINNLKDNGIIIKNNDDDNLNIDNALTYGINNKSDLMATNILTNLDGTTFDLIYHNKIYPNFKISLFGIYNVYNVLAAILCALSYNIDINIIKKRLKYIPKIKGRMERIVHDGINFLIDFGHTPNAIKSVLLDLNKIKTGNIIVVLGCGGLKDKTKRPLMGLIASNLSDLLILTSDDPITEDPINIINEMKSDITKENYITILDRKSAIKYAVKSSINNDIIIVFGKGVEENMNYNNQLYFHNDLIEIQKNIAIYKK